MNLSIYFHNECIAICMLLLIILFVLEAGNRRGSEWKRYIPALYIVALLFLTIDGTVFIIDGDANLIVFHKVIRSIYLIGLPVFGWLWLRCCAVPLKNLRFLHAPVMKALLALILTANAAFVILSWQSGDVYSVTDKGVHVPGTWIWLPTMLMYGQMFFAAILSLIEAFRAKTATDRNAMLHQAFYGVPMLAEGICRALLPEIPLVHFGFVITALLMFADSISSRITEDSLTGLMTQPAIEKRIAGVSLHKRDNDRMILVACDLDRFKAINDEFGHAVGDEALSRAGRAFETVCQRYNAVPSRLHGDEFVILVENVSVESVRCMMAELDTALNDQTQDVDYILSVSYGIAQYMPGMSIKTLFEVADANLYEQKRIKFGDTEKIF